MGAGRRIDRWCSNGRGLQGSRGATNGGAGILVVQDRRSTPRRFRGSAGNLRYQASRSLLTETNKELMARSRFGDGAEIPGWTVSPLESIVYSDSWR